MPRSGGLVSTFDWKRATQYEKLYNLEVEVNNSFMTKNYNTQRSENDQIILN